MAISAGSRLEISGRLMDLLQLPNGDIVASHRTLYVVPHLPYYLNLSIEHVKMATDDFVMTIESDGEDDAGQSKPKDVAEDTQLDPEFTFDLAADPYADFLDDTTDLNDLVKEGSKPVR